MRSLKLADSNLFIRYGGNEQIKVVKFKGIHSPHVKEQDWEFLENVGNGNKHQSLEVFGHVIQGEDLKKLILDLKQSRLLINREGYCYLSCEILSSSSNFNKIQYYRLNDIFGWSAYQVNPFYAFSWNRHNIKTNQVIVDTNNSNLERNYETKIRTLKIENNKKLQDLQDENDQKLRDLLEQNKKLQGLRDENDKKLQGLRNEKDALQRMLDNGHSSMPPQHKGRYSFKTEEYDNILRYSRPSKPDQFIFEIQSFPDLKQSIKDAQCHEFESPEFSVGGHTWTLSIYLDGNPSEDTDDHISLYLKKQRDQANRVEDLKLLVRFFIFSYKYKEYLTIQELPIKEFDDQFNTEAGIAQALKIRDFEDTKNGFVYGGKCRFGIEVFNMQSHPQTFTLTAVKKLYRGKCICRFNNYSTLPQDSPSYSKDEFKLEITSIKNKAINYTWKVQIYPTGIDEDEDTNASVYLELANTDTVSNGRHVFVDFELRLKCQDKSGKYHTQRRVAWFTQSDYKHGFDDFIPVSELNNINGKYKKDDSITIEVFFNKMFRVEDI